MKSKIENITKEQIEKLFKLAEFDEFEITKLEYNPINESMLVYSQCDWTDGEDNLLLEEAIVSLFTDDYENECDFSPGFELSESDYIQWALWCGILDEINFDNM